MSDDRSKVVIAGAGVAGLEALLALRDLAADRVDITLLAPTDTFVYRPLLVAEPFGITAHTRIELEEIVAGTGARHLRDSFASVDPAEGNVMTGQGEQLPYDCLLVALGTRPVDVVPGAISFGAQEGRRDFEHALAELGHRSVKRVAFIVPKRATWSIAAYELALLTARERDLRRLSGVELMLVTHEASPLEALGAPASQLAAGRLAEADITLRTATEVERFSSRTLRVADGELVEVDRAIALPGLEVPELAGLPQRDHGFLQTDVRMNVHGLERVWAAGDVTSFPIKQGGLAAQQAEVAAGSIAARAGARVAARTFQPVLRAALLTGGAPDYMRARLGTGEPTETSVGEALWWPPSKLAGPRLAPYLSRLDDPAQRPAARALVDRRPPSESEAGGDEHEHAIALILAAADADAAQGDPLSALRWLALAERLNLVLPQEYVIRRFEWLHELDPDVEPSEAARRIEPTLGDAAAAISDLERRIGWLREVQARTEGEMRADLSHLDRGLEQLLALSRRTGNYPGARAGS